MKRLLFFAAMLAMLASCSNDKSESGAPEESGASVEFRGVVTNLSRASTIASSGELTSFFVEAHTGAVAGAGAMDFMSVPVFRGAAGWIYAPKVCFPTDGSAVSFYAYAPIKDVNMSSELTIAAGKVSFGYRVPADQSVDNTATDLLVASVADKHDDGTDVAFVFQHALSTVTFSAANREAVSSELTYTISDIRITSLDNEGTFSYPFSSNSWSNAGARNVAYIAAIPESGVALSAIGSSASTQNLLSRNDVMMVLPQTPSSDAKVAVTFSLKDGSGRFIFQDEVREFPLPDSLVFAPANRYNLRFEFAELGDVSLSVDPPNDGNTEAGGGTLLGSGAIGDLDWELTEDMGVETLTLSAPEGEDIILTPEIVAELPAAVELVIGSGVSEIAADAFKNADGIETLVVSPAVSVIRSNAFFGSSLRMVTILGSASRATERVPNGTAAIEDFAFAENKDLTEVRLPNSLKTIGVSSFENCTSLAKINIPNGLLSIGDYAFRGCTSLTGINLSHTLATIGAGAFAGCTALEEIAVPRNITTIEEGTFDGCDNLAKVTLPDGLTTIGEGAFKDCASLEEINIPASVTTIDPGAFDGCDVSKLPEIVQETFVVEQGVVENLSWTLSAAGTLTISGEGKMKLLASSFASHPWAAFSDQIEKLVVEPGVTTIGNLAFARFDRLSSIELPNTITYIYGGAFAWCSALTEVDLPESLVYMECNAFGSSGLKEVFLPAKFTPIPNDAGERPIFLGSPDLQRIDVDPNNPYAASLDGVLMSKGCDTILEFPSGRTTYTIPAGVKFIANQAFWEARIAQIEITEGVETIGWSAFQDCDLEELVIPESVTKIMDNAFFDCSALRSVTIEGCPIIASRAFESYNNNTHIQDFTCLSSVPPTIRHSYIGIYKLEGATLHVPADALEAYKADKNWLDMFDQIVAIP